VRRGAARALKLGAIAFDVAAQRATPPDATTSLAGDRDLEWTFCQARLGDGPSRTLDFGADAGVPLSLAAALRGHEVVALDQLEVAGSVRHPAIRFVVADILDRPLAGERFDTVVNCSTVEHVGLAGRYGSRSAGDGDLDAMAALAELMGPDGRQILTIPVGRDRVCAPAHRIYGERRLPRLLERYETVEEQYWHKPADAWEPTDRATALAVEGSATFYALGLFVLRLAP
jgi:Caenorhabditis protein of unknown function, DUF268